MERKPSQIEFRHLETFCRVADLKSFSRAADDLFLTQPTVSGHILSLEQSLSLRLFDRASREVRLTKSGEVFREYALKLLSLRKNMLNALSEFSRGIRGELSLGSSTIPGEYLLPKLIGDFKKNHPSFVISLKIADTKEVIQYVLQDQVEFGVIGAKLNHPSLHYEKFEEDQIIVVAPSEHPLTLKKKVDLDELLKEPWIIREEGSGTRIVVERALRRKGRTLKQFNVVMEMGSTSSVKEGGEGEIRSCLYLRKSHRGRSPSGLFRPNRCGGLGTTLSTDLYRFSSPENAFPHGNGIPSIPQGEKGDPLNHSGAHLLEEKVDLETIIVLNSKAGWINSATQHYIR